jgi:hypothetical protein
MLLKFVICVAQGNEGEEKSGATQWTTSPSSFVQTYLINLVFEGNKISTGFKKVYLNGCVNALNDHFKINRIADQISNHLKILKKYSRINYLRNLSGALWDEDQFILSFDHEHYTNHFEVNMWLYLCIFFVSVVVVLYVIIVLLIRRIQGTRLMMNS